MSRKRPDLAVRLVESARLAARGASCCLRDTAIAEVALVPSLATGRAGAAKAAVAARLKQAVADLTGLDGEARTIIADKVIGLAGELERMPDRPGEALPLPDRPERFHWMDKD